jgi:hypothetical protein
MKIVKVITKIERNIYTESLLYTLRRLKIALVHVFYGGNFVGL